MQKMFKCYAESNDNPGDTPQQTTSSHHIDVSLLPSNLNNRDTNLKILGIQEDFPLKKY
jgi:hypothetical protein